MNRRLQQEALHVLKFVEEPIPEAPPGGAVVKVAYAGICHTDLHFMVKEYHPKFSYPRVLGHETSGTVYSLGCDAAKARPDLIIGDQVGVFPWSMCQNCANCDAGLNYCTTMHYGTGPENVYVYGIWRDGGYQNYIVIDMVKFLEKIPSGVQMDQASTLMCGGVTSYNATTTLRESIMRANKINGTATVGLIGAGGLALWAIQIIKAMYPPTVKIVAVDISDEKLEDAKQAGADMTHKWGTQESADEASDELIKAAGDRFDGIIDYIGIPSVIERAHLSIKLGGTLCLVGLTGNEMPPMTLNSIIRRNMVITGVIVGTRQQCTDLINLVNDGKVRPPPITHVTLDDVPMVLERLKKGTQRGRAVVKM